MIDNDLIVLSNAVGRRDVVFLAGSGISCGYPACLPSAADVVRVSAEAALPPEEGDAIKRIVDELQPEVFYERLLPLAGERCLDVWRILEAERHRAADVPFGPTLAHHLIVRLAHESGTPILTTNFDTLFEMAATEQGFEVCSDLLAHAKSGVTVWHLHGSIDQGVAALATTMSRITRTNRAVVDAIQELLRKHHLMVALDPIPWTRSERWIRCPACPQASPAGVRAGSSLRSSRMARCASSWTKARRLAPSRVSWI